MSNRASILFAQLVLLWVGCAPSDGAAVRARYVGRRVCAACHAEQQQAWIGSHHDRAMQEVSEATVLGDFDDAEFTYAGVTSSFYRRDGEYFVRTDGPDGELTEYAITYTFGVEPLQQYLIEFSDGRLQALNVCWDTRPAEQGGQGWFHLYPDERIDHSDILHWTGPLQNWNFMCAECHSTNLRKNYSPERDGFETSWSEIDVACEACHGPGSNHVAWAEDTPDDPERGLLVRLGDADGATWVMDAETGTARRSVPRESQVQLETCARCHSRRAIVSEDYLHGMPLVENYLPALLTDPLYHADGQILDEVYVYGSFLQSTMHAAGVTCSDCHDPHTLRLKAPGNGVCTSCHLPARFDTAAHHQHEAGSPAAACVACHMPARNYMVVDPRRDHSMRVPRPDLSLSLGTPNACNGCHPDQTSTWAAQQVLAWHGPSRSERPHYAQALHAGRSGAARADVALAALARDAQAPGIVRATAVSLLRENPGPAVPPALRRAVADDDPLLRLAAVDVADLLERRAQLELLGPLLGDPVRTVRVQAAGVLVPVGSGELPAGQAAAFDAALEEYRAAQRSNADRAEAHLNLGLLHDRLGEPEQAEAEVRRAIAMWPQYPPSYVNLTDLLRTLGRETEAEATLRQGLAISPRSAELHHALGLSLVRQQRHAEGLDSLRHAAQLAPDNPRYAYLLGVALNSLGDPEQALAVLDAAHRKRPGDRDLLTALATISRDAGQLAQATAYARKLSDLDR